MTRREAAAWAAIVVPWIALLVPTLSAPPVGRESWREADGLIVARNYCREHAPFSEPRVDGRRDGPGITGMEFPLLNWVEGAALCHGLPMQTVGRTLSLLFALLGAAALGALMRDAFGPRAALTAVALYLYSPLVFYYGRATMPDVPALSLGLCGLFLVRRALRRTGAGLLAEAAAGLGCLALAALLKLPFATLGLPAAWSIWSAPRQRHPLRLLGWALAGAATLAPAVAWYRYALHLEEQYDTHVFLNNMRRPLSEMLFDLRSASFYKLLLIQHPFDVWVFPGVTVLAVLAVALSFRRVPGWLWAWMAGSALFFLLGGYPTVHHIYYGLAAVPVLCCLAAVKADHCATRWNRPWLIAALVLAAAGYGVFRTRHLFPREEVAQAFSEAKASLDAARPRGEPVTVFSGGSPLIFWMLDRKGWFGEADGQMSTHLACVDRVHPDAPPSGPLEGSLQGRGCRPLHQNHELSVWACP